MVVVVGVGVDTYGRHIKWQHPTGAPEKQDGWHDSGRVGQRDEGCVMGPQQTGQGEVEKVLITRGVSHGMEGNQENGGETYG